MNRVLVDSGIDWIGKVPSNWKIAKVKNVFFHHKNVAKEKSQDFNRVSLTLNGVILRDKDDTNGLQPEDFCGYQIVYEDDIIFKLIDLENINTSRVGRSPYEGITSPAYILLHEKDDVNRYYDYYFKNLYYQEVFNNLGGNGVRSAINKDDLLNISLLIPPREVSNRIANYLDKKCKLIDSIIESNRREISLLEEYKQNLFDNTCLKGIKKHEFVNSGHYSLTSYPKGWKFTKTIYALSMPITDGPHETPNLISEGIPFISAEAIKNGKIDFNKKRGFISQEDYDKYSIKYKPIKNDIYMIKSGGTTGKVGIVETDDLFNIWSPLGVYRADKNKMNYKYLFYLLQTNFYQQQVQLNWSYGTQQNIGMRVLEKLKILIPPLNEQKEIVQFIEKKVDKIDNNIELRFKIIEKLEEYKKSLIFEVVTGKKEV